MVNYESSAWHGVTLKVTWPYIIEGSNIYQTLSVRMYVKQICSCEGCESVWETVVRLPLILKLGTRWKWVVTFMLRPLYYLGEIPRYPSCMRLMGPRAIGGVSEMRKICHLCPYSPQPVYYSCYSVTTPVTFMFMYHNFIMSVWWKSLRFGDGRVL